MLAVYLASIADEECDCGPAAECDSRCCEPLTCRLVVGARCATGES